ncbi:MAG: M28 family peptidase, partial [Candidatus Riflebacteria bacterium]|nr:M28 family peptidase [Candidatus Riflebacteria bacterium]
MMPASGVPGPGAGPPSPARRGWLAIFLLTWVVGWVGVAWWGLQPPAPRPATAAATEFSAERAMRYVAAMAGVPHPQGSPANRRVRDYLVGELRAMGLEPIVFDRPRVLDDRLHHGEDVLARVPGRTASPAFLLMAHRDSVCTGPGAADNLAGVAAILETARALRAGPPLAHDVILAFPDGEEIGLLGGKSFADWPVASEVAVMANLEARGVYGPSFLFDTSPDNGWLIAELVRAGLPVRGSSMMGEVYRALPFRTDFDIVRERVQGFNIAFVGGFPAYHTARDDVAHLDPASLQHHGEYALGLARHFANLDLTTAGRAPDVVWFQPFGGWSVQYPKGGNLLLTALVLLLGAGFVLAGLRRRAFRPAELGTAVHAIGKILVQSGLAGVAITGSALLARGKFALYQSHWYALAGFLAGAAILLHGCRQAGTGPQAIRPDDGVLSPDVPSSADGSEPPASPGPPPGDPATGATPVRVGGRGFLTDPISEAFHQGGLPIGAWVVGSVAWLLPPLVFLTWRWPGAAWSLHWPMLGVLGSAWLAGLAGRPALRPAVAKAEAMTLTGRGGAEELPVAVADPALAHPVPDGAGPLAVSGHPPAPTVSGWAWFFLALGAVPTVLVGVAIVWPLHLALTVVGLPVLMVVGVALATLLLPLLEPLRLWGHPRLRRWGLVAAGLVWAAAVATGGPSLERPVFSMLRYFQDREQNHAAWVSTDHHPGAWTDQFFPASGTVTVPTFRRFHFLPLTRMVTSASAPAILLPACQVTATSPVTASGTCLCLLTVQPASETAS